MIPASIIGCGILLGFGLIFLLIAGTVSKRYSLHTLEDFVLAGRSLPFGYLSAALFVSWTWTTSIIGSAEAAMQYGVSGGLNYTLWANLPFLLFIPFVVRLRKMMPEASTFTEFIGERFNPLLKDIYFIFAAIVAMYVLIEQAAGVGMVFEDVFQIPFKLTVFITIMIVTAYISIAGIRGAVYNGILQFILINILFLLIIAVVLDKLDLNQIFEALERQAYDPGQADPGEMLRINSMQGFKYGMIALVVAIGQIFLDQGWYSMALSAKNTKTMVWSLIFGIFILWMPIPLISASIFGPLYFINHFSDVKYDMIFAILIFIIGTGAAAKCLIGLQALFTVDYYKNKIKKDADTSEKIRFGRIDTFCGIFFAAPCGALIGGMYCSRLNGRVALLSIISGLAAGFGTWLFKENGWFVGSILSLVIPVIVILAFALFEKDRYNFYRLRQYRG
jgi:Na+/proline symporter